jgi:hypothetical protein
MRLALSDRLFLKDVWKSREQLPSFSPDVMAGGRGAAFEERTHSSA